MATFTAEPLRSLTTRSSPWRDLAGGALLLSVWIGLWSFFTLGVAAPAGRLDASAGRGAIAIVKVGT